MTFTNKKYVKAFTYGRIVTTVLR